MFEPKEDLVEKLSNLPMQIRLSDLHTVLIPYLLCKMKEDAEKSLHPKEETILEVALTSIKKTYYKAIYENNIFFLLKGAKPDNAPSLMNFMMDLKKCCNQLFLIRGDEERILFDAADIEPYKSVQ